MRQAWGLRLDLDAGSLDTASIGVPPIAVSETVAAARAGFAALIKVPPARVATGAAVSALVGLLAAALPDRARVPSPPGSAPA